MTQPDHPREDALPESGGGERHSRERIAQPGAADRARRWVSSTASRVLSPRRRVAWQQRLPAPLVLALVPLYWIVDATWRASVTTIGRDQGIFHYIAWAVRNGDVDYRDVRDVNGPLVHLIHLVMLFLGGGDEHRFHVIDLAATGVSFAAVGFLLPGIVARRAPTWIERLVWAAATWVVLSGQYAMYLYWNQAQRESFCDWFLLPSLALQIMRPARSEAGAFRRIVAIAGLSTVTWFGKPSFLLFTVMQLGVLLVDDAILVDRKRRLKAFGLGGLLGATIPVLYLLRFGSVRAFLQITLRDVPQIYRYIWARSAQEILGDEGPLSVVTLGLAVSALLVGLVVARELPRRMLALALANVVGLAGVVAQHKGFGYHFHPITAATNIGALVVVILVGERFRHAPRRKPLGRYLELGLATALALYVASNMRTSPHTKAVWILAGGETPEKRTEQEYFDNFKSHDFFPWEMHQGARWLTDVTKPDARVQVYGMDPYILFLARRRSATPYIYAYDLNADAALDGGWSNRPTWLEAEHIRAVRAEHERDMLARLRAAPPEAFVFIDRSPLISYQDAWEDFRHCCSESARWVAERYHAARSFGEVHIWLRDDMPVPDVEGQPWP